MAARLAERNGGWIGIAALLAILLLGLALRLGEAWDGREPVYDARAYAAIAANLERGEGFTVGAAATQPSSNYSPGLPLAVTAIYRLSGGVHERLARIVLALLGWLAVPLAYLIGRRLGGAALGARHGAAAVGAGLLGAALVAVFPALLEYQGMLMSEPLAATLLAAAVLAIFSAGDAGRRHGPAVWLLPGALLGALSLVRPEYLGVTVLVALVVLVGGLWGRPGGAAARAALSQAALLLLGAALLVAPWTVRNAEALGRFVPISTGGGQVLFAGTYVPSGGNPERVGAEVVARQPGLFAAGDARRLRLEQILARLAAARYPHLESDRALARIGRERLWDELSADPLGYGGFLAAKLARLWSPGPRAVMRSPGWTILHWATLALALLGLVVLARRRRWEAAILTTVIVAITVVSLLLVASPRRVLVLVPLLGPLAGCGGLALVSMRRRPAAESEPAQSRS